MKREAPSRDRTSRKRKPSKPAATATPAGFDPAAAALPGAGVFGLPGGAEEALVHLIPVPWDVTTSYRPGTAAGPEAIREASMQVDLYDLDNGRPYESGIWMLPVDRGLKRRNAELRRRAERVIARGGRIEGSRSLQADLLAVNAGGEALNAWVRQRADRALDSGKLVGLVGGDHSTPYGLIAALAERHPGMGILHFDAHHDLRPAYEGFTWSHASIMHNVVTRLDGIGRLVQVGIRDFSEGEKEVVDASDRRIVAYYDAEIGRALMNGVSFLDVARTIVAQLPDTVYVSFDVDGLDPKLCPSTGTPVPGGLEFGQACQVLESLVDSGRRIVGFDLNEVAPGETEWDAAVGARLLYKLIGYALRSRVIAG